MEKIIEYGNKKYLVTARQRNYTSASHTEWEYVLCEQREFTRKRLFRDPIQTLVWVRVYETWESSSPVSLEGFIKEAKDLIESYHQSLEYARQFTEDADSFREEFAKWDGVIK